MIADRSDAVVRRGRRIGPWDHLLHNDKASGSLLQLASSDLLLVHSLDHGMGSAEPHRTLLEPSSRVGSCVPFRHGHRLPRQLA
jgi:hypothetical protein